MPLEVVLQAIHKFDYHFDFDFDFATATATAILVLVRSKQMQIEHLDDCYNRPYWLLLLFYTTHQSHLVPMVAIACSRRYFRLVTKVFMVGCFKQALDFSQFSILP